MYILVNCQDIWGSASNIYILVNCQQITSALKEYTDEWVTLKVRSVSNG